MDPIAATATRPSTVGVTVPCIPYARVKAQAANLRMHASMVPARAALGGVLKTAALASPYYAPTYVCASTTDLRAYWCAAAADDTTAKTVLAKCVTDTGS